MSWLQKLHETYERCAASDLPDAKALLPIAHTTQQAHIEIVIDGQGRFRRARVIAKEEQQTLIPCTESAAGRAGTKPAPFPLCDKLQYVAADFVAYGGTVTSGFAKAPDVPHAEYLALLREWEQRSNHQKLKAILAYVERGRVVRDLVSASVLPTDPARTTPTLLKEWHGPGDPPEIFRRMPKTAAPEDAFVRWRVETADDPETGTWEDDRLIKAWQHFYAAQSVQSGLCYSTGMLGPLAEQHPRKLRNQADQARLISSNDTSGFTFRGRFVDSAQAVGVSFEVTQKAHNALRWLIARKQAHRNGDQVILSWTPAGRPIPDPWAHTLDLLAGCGTAPASTSVYDAGQEFAVRLRRALGGYRASLEGDTGVMVMALDSATPGRLAITYYRELGGSEFLERIRSWHENLAWHQYYGRDLQFVGAPSPRDIADAAYGRRLDEKLRKATVERLVPCIVDGQPIPMDLVTSCSRRALARAGLKPSQCWQWEKRLGVACSLHRGFYRERRYSMALEGDRKTRDYLYGRLIAVAEHLEWMALTVANEKRDTTAGRLFQRFADRPYSTWRTIELALGPYKTRLRASRGGFLWNMEVQLDEILGSFSSEDEKEVFTNDRPLSGEFLLGYHCQRQVLRHAHDDTDTSSAAAD